MGYIESKAAESTEAAKYNADREAVAHWNAIQDAKRAEAGRVLNQGAAAPSGLAGIRADGYAEGLSPEDAYRISQVRAAQDANAIKGMVDKNRAYNDTLREAEVGLRNGGSIDANQMNAIREYRNSIDPGLAAKWMADREAFK